MIVVRIVIVAFLGIISLVSAVDLSASPESERMLLSQVIKLKTYTYNRQTQSYIATQYGSAVIIAKNRIITNAHVILQGDTDMPTWLYEICLSKEYQSTPACSMTAKLIAYDPIADLAILEPSTDFSAVPVRIDTQKNTTLSIGQTVVIYGYPTIGGETITRTEGKIAGYQNLVYKIDVTIDHGNSGGWAFDSIGNLIGIPYAVSSDNGVIGYMISRSTIDDFLHERTLGYQKMNEKLDQKFWDFIAKNHRQMRQSRLIKGNSLDLVNPPNSWFSLTETASDRENSLSTWFLRDSYGRVSLSLSCTNDASRTLGYQWDTQTIDGMRNESPKLNFLETTVGKNQEFYRIRTSPKSPKNDGSQENVDVWYYKNYDACFAEIYSTNLVQDSKMIAKAEKLLQSAKFRSKYILSKNQKNPYFSVQNIPEKIRSIFSIDTDGSKSVTLDFLIDPKRSLHASFRGEKYTSLNDYFVKPFYSVDSYSWALTIDALVQQFSKNIENTQTKILTSKNGKKMIFSYLLNAENKDTTLNFYYPYTLEGEYYVWYWSKTFSNGTPSHIEMIRTFFSLLDLPGKEVFP